MKMKSYQGGGIYRTWNVKNCQQTTRSQRMEQMSRPFQGSNHANNTLISNFQPPDLRGNTPLLFKLLSLFYFVTTALTNWHTGETGCLDGSLGCVQLLVSAQVMILRFVSSGPTSGSALAVWSLLGILSLPLSLPLPHSCCLCLKING